MGAIHDVDTGPDEPFSSGPTLWNAEADQASSEYSDGSGEDMEGISEGYTGQEGPELGALGGRGELRRGRTHEGREGAVQRQADRVV